MKTTTTLCSILAAIALLLTPLEPVRGQSLQIGAFTSGATIYISVKPTANFPANYLTDIVFTLRWPASYGVSLGAVVSTLGIAKAGGENPIDEYIYQKFYITLAPAITWYEGSEYQLASVPVTQTGEGVGIFELAPAGTITDGDPYVEIDGLPELNDAAPFYRPSTVVPLPVELTTFTVKSDEKGTVLSWSTATETNNAGFDIERAPAGVAGASKQWAAIGFVEGSGTSNAPKQYTFRNTNVLSGKYCFRLKQIDRDGRFQYSPEVEAIVAAPRVFALSQNYPNPFNPTTTINFAIAAPSRVSMKVYDITGREVASVVAGDMPAGDYSVPFDARALASGVYLYRLTAVHDQSAYTETKRFMLLK